MHSIEYKDIIIMPQFGKNSDVIFLDVRTKLSSAGACYYVCTYIVCKYYFEEYGDFNVVADSIVHMDEAKQLEEFLKSFNKDWDSFKLLLELEK
nr:MAG TPA: hypothetical protein [Caudoviricetes sp.]